MRTRQIAVFAAGALMAGLVVAGGVAVAESEPQELTACVKNENGQMRLVDSGDECLESEYPVAWNQRGPEGPQGPEGPPGPPGVGGETLEVLVDCDAGDTVGAALDEAQTHPGPVSITISGVCVENVSIQRDDVLLAGVQRSDGLSAGDCGSTVEIRNARGAELSNMTLSGGEIPQCGPTNGGILASKNSTVMVTDVTARGAHRAITAFDGAEVDLFGCTLVDNEGGVTARYGGIVQVDNCDISGGYVGLEALRGGVISGNARISGAQRGVVGWGGGDISLFGGTIEGSGELGVFGRNNSAITLTGTRIASSLGPGVRLQSGGSLEAYGNTVIEGNGDAGIVAGGGSSVSVFDTIVRDNVGSGILVLSLSYANVVDLPGDPQTQIVNNGGFGVACNIAYGEVGPELGPGSDLSGNAAGPINCPLSG